MIYKFLNKLFNRAESLLENLLDRNHNPVCGFSNEDDRVLVFVEKKERMDTLMSYVADPGTPWTIDDVVPSEVDGKPTDVIEVGELRALTDRKNYDPVVGGCEIAPVGVNYVGTAGIVATVPTYNNVPLVGKLQSFTRIISSLGFTIEDSEVLLTNAHVAAPDVTQKAKGTRIQQSGAGWGREIGETVYNKVLGTGSDRVDCAVVALNEEGRVGYALGDVKATGGISQPHSGMEVHKYGRTTGYTEGTCLTTNSTFDIRYSEDLKLRFRGCQTFTHMSEPGDSGSVIVDKQTGEIVSLLFAGSSKVTIGCNIQEVVKQTGVDLT